MELDVFDEGFDKELDRYVGKQIKTYRQKKKLSQKELGKMIGVVDSAISSYELGKNSLSLSMIFKIAKVLDIKVNDLFPEIGQGTDPNKEVIEKIKTWDDERIEALTSFVRVFEVDR